jgi:hypothetical protein
MIECLRFLERRTWRSVRALASFVAAFVFCICFTGCSDSPIFGEPELRLQSLHVSAGDGFSNHVEVEVHVYDADTDERLGCCRVSIQTFSGPVELDVLFNSVQGDGKVLKISDVAERTIYFDVWEDDWSACPTAPGSEDDFLGKSPHFSGSDLSSSKSMSFGQVANIEVGL